MSPIALPVAELKSALTGLGKILDRHAKVPVLNTIKLERTKDGWITLTATDLERFATVRLEQPTDGEPMSLLVPFEALAGVMKTCGKGEQLLLEPTAEEAVSIKYAIGSQFAEQKVDTVRVTEFPDIPRIKGEPLSLPDSLRESLHQAFDCASEDETRYVLNAAFVDVSQNDCHCVVGTDGRHLYSSNSFSLPLNKGLIIPTHRFLKWKEFNNDGEWQLKIGKVNDSEQIQISTRRWRYITREIEGNYPNWRQVVPSADAFKTQIEFDAASLDQVLATIQRMPCHNTLNHDIGLEVKEGTVQLLGRNQTADSWTRVDVVNAKATGESALVFLNRQFLAKALKFGLTKIEIINSKCPLLFSNGGKRMVVMPIRSEAEPPNSATVATAPEQNGVGEAETVNSATEQIPAATSTPAAQPTERNQMVSQPTSTDTPDTKNSAPQNGAPRIDEVLEVIDTLRASLQEGVSALKDLGGKLRQIQKEQKVTEREFQSIRSTLRSLQNVRI